MKKIKLTQGLFALVDDDDFDRLNIHKWHTRKNRSIFYAGRSLPRVKGRQQCVLMHVEIIGKKQGYITDHADGNGLNNQKNNLRHATNSQNTSNTKIRKDSTTGIKGISIRKDTGKYQAMITSKGKQIYLGVFKNKTDAHNAYKNAAKKLKGDFAKW